MSRFRDSPRFANRLRDMSDDELLQEIKQRFNEDSDKFFEPRFSRRDCYERPSPHFPRGFSFDDDADIFDRPRRDGIRSHLDDLAARHPELAEHLRGPPWSFGSSLLRDRHRRRRDSGSNNSDNQQQQSQQHPVDEDARSQASGSSAASGASAVSSRSSDEPDLTSSSAIPQYGLRNTVDIGQQQRRRGMEMSPEMSDRGQRSMSAPPENRQQQEQSEQQQQQSQPGQGKRFVSRVDITPQHNQQRSQSPNKPSSNVRHIPIFVEGRDEPVMPRFTTDKAPSPSPPLAFHQRQPSPPSFHRPSHFNDHFSRQWPPGFYESTFDPGFESSFRPMRRHQQFQQHQQPQYHQEPQYQKPQSQYYQHQQPQHRKQQQQPQYRQQQQQKQHTQQQHEQQEQQPQQQQESQKPKQVVPKDPLEKVAEVQKEVNDLAEQVRRYAGGSRQDKEYIYLDEMLTRELIKLDDIETEGRENVRQARKNAIKSIQETISLLETKAPLPVQQEQQPMEEEREQKEEQCANKTEEPQASEPMDVDAKRENNEPILLPPGSSTETKEKTESSKNETMTTESESQNQRADSAAQQQTNMEIEQEEKTETKEPLASTSTDEAAKRADETNRESKPYGEQQKDDNAIETTTESKDVTLKQQPEEAKDSQAEVDNVQQSSTESPKSQKKTKKKQQQPVSEQAIPLPPPSAESAK